MVYGHEIGGEVTSFGTTGYTYGRVFLLYDRASESVWYPLEDDRMTSVGGALQGRSIPVLAEPKRVTMKRWRLDHPDTLVLLGDASDFNS